MQAKWTKEYIQQQHRAWTPSKTLLVASSGRCPYQAARSSCLSSSLAALALYPCQHPSTSWHTRALMPSPTKENHRNCSFTTEEALIKKILVFLLLLLLFFFFLFFRYSLLSLPAATIVKSRSAKKIDLRFACSATTRTPVELHLVERKQASKILPGATATRARQWASCSCFFFYNAVLTLGQPRGNWHQTLIRPNSTYI